MKNVTEFNDLVDMDAIYKELEDKFPTLNDEELDGYYEDFLEEYEDDLC